MDSANILRTGVPLTDMYPSMDKLPHAQKSVGWNNLLIPKRQRYSCDWWIPLTVTS